MLTTALLWFSLPALAADAPPPVPPRRLALAREVSDVEAAEDGRTVYFVTDITGELELWRMPGEGGWPVQLTDLAETISSPALSPDGRLLAFSADRGGDERGELYLVPAAGGETDALTVSTRSEISPAWSPDGTKLAFLADPERGFQYQLYVLDMKTRKERRLTRESESLHEPMWSPDGKWIAALRSGDDRRGALVLAAADGSSVRAIEPPVEGGLLAPEAWSDEGLLATAEDQDGFHTLYLLDPASGKGRWIGPKGADIERAVWEKESGIVFVRNEFGAAALYRLRRPSDLPETLLPPRGWIDALAAADHGRSLFYVWSDGASAPDVWRLDLRTRKPVRLTDSMPGGLSAERLSRAEIVSYPGEGGLPIRAIYLSPRVPRLGSPPPLVVSVHGGPNLQQTDSFEPLHQALAEAGFAVLAPNYRGSTGFGRKFLDSNRKDWGGKDRLDIVAGVEHLAKAGKIDPKRVGVTGGSYGGYMTLYALARDEKRTFRAGVAAYGMFDLIQDYELSQDRFREWYETQMGSPRTDEALFKDRSPMTHMASLKAPLLIFQGANDTNVPEAESRLAHEKLKALGRDVSLVVYPDEGHGFYRRKNLADFYERSVAFFREKLGRR